MNANLLHNLIIKTLEDNKAEDIISLDVHGLTTITDWMIICTATSKRHAHALADHITTTAKANGIRPLGVEGEAFNEWILVDLGDAILHIMLSDIRKFYSLEKLWDITLEKREDAN